MAVTEAIIEEIKARTDLADLIASYGIQIRRAGASVKACCPFHNEKTPSFNINTSKGFYHCFGCGESGDAITFVQKMEGLGFLDAARKLAEQCGVKIEERSDPADGQRKRLYALMLELAQFYHRCLRQTKAAQIARDYLKSRDLGEAAQEEFLIGYAPVGAAPILAWAEKHRYTPAELELAGVLKGDYHRFGGRLMFTIRDRRGRVVAFSGRQLVENKKAGKYVNSPETPIFKKSQVLFGFDKAAGHIVKAPHREIICCEGQIDTIRLHLCGFTTAVASQGTAFTEEHAEMVKKVADAALLLYDDDAAGHKATVKVARLLLARELPVRVVSLPDPDDPDSFLRRHGAAALQQRIDAAESIVSFQCRAEKAKEAGKLVSFDINYRDNIWGYGECLEECKKIFPSTDLLKISEEELSFVGGEENIPSFMKEDDIAVVVLTLGGDGARIYHADRSELIPSMKAKVIDTTGAGDAYWGAFLSGLLRQDVKMVSDITMEKLILAGRYGAVSGGLCVQKPGGIPAIPALDEIEAAMRKL